MASGPVVPGVSPAWREARPRRVGDQHARLQAAVARELGLALARPGRPCNVFGPDARAYVEADARVFYPDASVVCGKRQVALDDPHAMTNPTVLIEVRWSRRLGSDKLSSRAVVGP